MKRFLSILMVAIIGIVPAFACNIPDPGDLDQLIEAIESLPPQDERELAKEVIRKTVIQNLKGKPQDDIVGEVFCWRRPVQPDSNLPYGNTPGANDGWMRDERIKRTGHQGPTVAQVLECLKKLATGFDGEPFNPEYEWCVLTAAEQAAKAEEEFLNALSKSPGTKVDGSIGKWKNGEGYEFKDGSVDAHGFEWHCLGNEDESLEEYRVDVIEGAAVKRDTPELVKARILVKLMLKLDSAPAIFTSAVAVSEADAFAKILVLICVQSVGEPNWGCASAPGLPGFNGTIVSQPQPGGDNP